MTTEDVYALRESLGWVSPLKPLEPGDSWCLADFPGGLYEFLCHPDVAAHCVEHGIVLDGKRLPAKVVDDYPLMNGVLIRAVDHDLKFNAFHDSAQAQAAKLAA